MDPDYAIAIFICFINAFGVVYVVWLGPLLVVIAANAILWSLLYWAMTTIYDWIVAMGARQAEDEGGVGFYEGD
ncbi:hypothetical protein FN846DRAFT_911403 [Sphaerosporella brunnea]|uniref:Uncharacterized protein n=1 Tax=Sphaerosporella brunnea TaxID=1250544 RepID=A0A5J5EKX2_9PEZI|nr:hypothetical protein FN846DRAFT_911403 [Sphaerosporella brunnea]